VVLESSPMNEAPAFGLRLSLFGSPRLLRILTDIASKDELKLAGEQNVEQIKFSRRKVVALLAYLAVTDRAHSREVLAALLWPDADPTLAHSYLRRELAILNKILGEGWLETDRGSVRLSRRDTFWLDVTQFWDLLAQTKTHDHPPDEVCPLCLPLLTQAIDLYRDSFMAGFFLSGSQNFTEWQRSEGENLHRGLVEAFDKLVRGYLVRSEFNSAIRYARRWLTAEPCDELAHRQLMKLYAWTGNRTAALNQYQECVRLLANEVDQPPEAATQELYEAIRTDTLPGLTPKEKPKGQGIEQHPPDFPNIESDGTPPSYQHNLPSEPTLFVGREEELAEIRRLLLAEPGCRMLTLVGPGGMGKTRLALRTARELLTAFPDGVFLVSLAPVSSTRLLTPTIAEALNLSFGERPDLKGQLLNYLRQKTMLLLLDNFEHMLSPRFSSSMVDSGGNSQDGEEILVDILAGAPNVKILITSRERLSLREEWVFEVGGLAYPLPVDTSTQDAHRKPPAHQFEEYSAVRLFTETARRTQTRFSPTGADQVAIVEICQLVEGVPLGIELASAWVELLSIKEIAQKVRQNLDFLESPLRNIPDRHRSLRALFEHSWQLLSVPERQLISKLSVFRGSFSHHAAEQVADATLPLLKSLIDKSMLRAISTGQYEMHEIIRQYVVEKLEEDPEKSQGIRARHCSYYAAFLQQQEAGLLAAQHKPLADIADEIDNVYAAWDWAVAHKRLAEIGQSLISLHLFFFARNRIQEGAELYRQAIDSLRGNLEDSKLVLAQLLSRYAHFVYRLGLHRQAKRLLIDSLTMLRQIDHNGVTHILQREKAFSLYHLGAASRVEGEYEQARQSCHESLSLYRAANDYQGMAIAIKLLGIIAGTVGDFEDAQKHFQEALEIYRHLDDQVGIANSLNDLGIVADRMGQYGEAKQLHRECLIIRRKSNDLWGIGTSLNNLGLLAYEQGEYAEAREFLQESLALQEKLGDQYEIANCLANLGLTLRALTEYREARRAFLKALRSAIEIGSTALILEVLAGIAILLISSEPQRRKEAAKLLAFVEYHPSSETLTKKRAERRLAELAVQLSPEEMTSARHAGKTSEMELVVAEIIGEIDRGDE
jgi:predicted ATPase/DNA-binding SARP family transcriptional activator/Flp pilus assembly protein TadD